MPSHIDSRQILRRQLRQARKSLSPEEQLNAAQKVASQIITNAPSIEITKAQHIAIYLSNDGEISPHLLCEHYWQQSKYIYLPVIKEKHLVFAPYTKNTVWQKNQFGIKEPIVNDYKSGNELDLVFLPLVGFDDQGGRLGMGGGFYDRTFENKSADKAPLLIGLAHNCQEVKSLPVEGWDVPLQAIITPTKALLV